MQSHTCPSRDGVLSLLNGTAAEESVPELEAHLGECDECRQMSATLNIKGDTMVSALRQPQQPDEYEKESELKRASEVVEAIGREPSFGTREQLEAGATPPELPTPELGQYQLLEKLGEGGMGAVFKALHTRLNKVVALKVLPASALADPQAVARFDREMRAVGSLQHPNIIGAHDAGDVDGTHYLVMELVEGDDLSKLVNRVGPLPVGAACELVRQAGLGLQHAHENGMVHRDIKPSNLMLTGDGVVKILDMGLALLSEQNAEGGELTGTGQLMGTLDYMAPEQGSDTHNVDIRADIYSLGATLYKLLAGRAPFAGEKFTTPISKLQALALKEPDGIETLRPDLPADLTAIVHRMLAKDPSERFATPGEVAAALAPFSDASLGGLLTDVEANPLTSIGDVSDPDAGTVITQPLVGTDSSVDAEDPTVVQTAPAAGEATAKSRPATSPAGPARRVPWPLVAGLGGAALLLIAGIVFFLKGPDGTTIRVEVLDPNVKVELAKTGFVLTDKGKEPVTIEPGEHVLKITKGDLTFTSESFEITKGEDVVVKVEMLEGEVRIARNGDDTIGVRPNAPPGDPVAGDPDPPPADPQPPRQWWPIDSVEVPALAKTSPFDDLRREDIDPDELAAAEEREPMPDLVAILGDSRFAHTEPIVDLDFDPTSGELISTARTGLTRWSLETGRRTGELSRAKSWIDGPGRASVASEPRITVFAEPNGRLEVTEGPSAKTRFTIDVGRPWTVLAVQPDGAAVIFGFKDGSHAAWSTESGQKLFETDPAPEDAKGANVTDLAIAPNSEWFVSATASGQVAIRSSEDGAELRTLDGPASNLAISPDGTRIATVRDKHVVILKAESGEQVFATPESAPIRGLAFSPDGKAFVTVAANTMIVWDVANGDLQRRIGARDLTGPVTFTPDGRRLVAVVSELDPRTRYGFSSLRIWDVATGEDVLDRSGPLGPITDVRIGEDGRLTAVATDASLTTWDVGTREIDRHGRTPVTGVMTGAFNADGSIAYFGRPGKFTRWDVARDLELDTFNGHYFNPARLVVHGKGSKLVTTGAFALRTVVDVDAKQQMKYKLAGNVAAFTPDGRTLVVAGSDVHGLDVATGEILASVPDSGRVARLQFSPDGGRLVTGMSDGRLVIRETQGMTRVRELRGGSGEPAAVRFSRDGRFVATVSASAVTVWDLDEKSPQPRKSFRLGTPFTQPAWQGVSPNVGLEFTPEGRHVVLGRRNGTLQVFRIAEASE